MVLAGGGWAGGRRPRLPRPRLARGRAAAGAASLALAAACTCLFTSLLERPTPSGTPAQGAGAAGEGDPQAAQFSSPEREATLQSLEARWADAFQELGLEAYPAIASDPFFTTDTPGLLRRYLLATGFDVEEALVRLQDTARWRRDWDVLAYHEPGAASTLFAEESNPGSEMYFADSLSFDKSGRPFVAGRMKFANAENMHPWRHLRAGVFVFEMMATKVAAIGRGPASYVLDIGPIGVQGTVSGTAGLDRAYDEGKNPYYTAGAGTRDAPSAAMVEELGELDSGFAVLKAAILILNRHYPGFIRQVYYLNSDMLFWGAFKIFSRWISDRGSIDFTFLGPAAWREAPLGRLLDTYPKEGLPPEWGGTGPALDGDAFLARAIRWYEEHAEAHGAQAAAAAAAA